MSDERGVLLSLVERGWQAARLYSLHHAGERLHCVHLVKGRLGRDVHALIAPVPHVRLVSVPRNAFWLIAALSCAWWRMTGRLRSVLVDNERSYRRLRSWGWLHVKLLLVTLETPDGVRHAVPVRESA